VLPPSALLVLFIFIAETCVVTICTMRTIFVARGMKYLAPLLGFFEVSIWLLAIGQVMKNLNDWSCSVAFAAGFSLGNYLGILLEVKLAMGQVVVRMITCREAAELAGGLRGAGYGVTCVDAHGGRGPVRILLTIVPRKQLEGVLGLARQFDPKIFYSVDELQVAAEGVTPVNHRLRGLVPGWPLRSPTMRRSEGAPS
jgi:uncharacterized protein YebE (UPF0316 family)